jgi:hypothetical protein
MNNLIKICCQCQKILGFKPPANASHGYCRAHWIEAMAQIIPMPEVMVRLEKKENELTFCPCLIDN